jgi:hypothetical protein
VGIRRKKHPSIKQLPSTPSGRKSSCRRHPRSARCPRSPLFSHVVHTAPHYSPSSPLCHGLINMQNSSGHPSTTPAAPVVPSKSLAQSPSSMLTPAAMPSKAKSRAAGQGGGVRAASSRKTLMCLWLLLFDHFQYLLCVFPHSVGFHYFSTFECISCVVIFIRLLFMQYSTYIMYGFGDDANVSTTIEKVICTGS